jgi:hypothetical protein
MKVVVFAVGFALCASRPVHACGVPDFSGIGEAIASMFPKPEAVSTPVVVLGVGSTFDHDVVSANAGWAWGEKDGGLFAGSDVTRVLFGVTRLDDHQPAELSLTYGWYENQIGTLGLDLGAIAQGAGVGPVSRLTFGFIPGITLQLTGGVTFEPAPHAIASAELALQLPDIAGKL